MRQTMLIDLDLGRPPDPNPARRRLLGAALVLVGLALAWSVLALSGVSGARAYRSAAVGQPLVEATHLPPLLTTAGDRLDSLRYDISCTTPGTDVDQACDVGGTVYVRQGQSGPFTPVELRLDAAADAGRYVATLPAALGASPSGFSYYAVIRDRVSGATTTLPAGGAAAPQRSLRLANPVVVDLGSHRFGATTAPSARAATAAWGDGTANVGLEEGAAQLAPIGASSFDVDSARNVTVLDEAHRRLLEFTSAGPRVARAVPVAVQGTIADLALQDDGNTYVLESVGDPGSTPLIRRFDSAGQTTGTWHTSDPGASALRHDATGLQVLQYPASQWMPVATGGTPDLVGSQRAGGRPGRAIAGGLELVSQREGDEARIAVVGPRGILRSWALRSDTPLAEIQLVEPHGPDVVAVLRTYSDTRAEFVVLDLGQRGVVRQLSISAADFAETAPFARFRLVGSALYHLGSTPSEMFVDRYNLEVTG